MSRKITFDRIVEQYSLQTYEAFTQANPNRSIFPVLNPATSSGYSIAFDEDQLSKEYSYKSPLGNDVGRYKCRPAITRNRRLVCRL
jgi:hypothetical protein